MGWYGPNWTTTYKLSGDPRIDSLFEYQEYGKWANSNITFSFPELSWQDDVQKGASDTVAYGAYREPPEGGKTVTRYALISYLNTRI